jgi:hypothetical protein
MGSMSRGSGRVRQHGVLSPAYSEVRKALIDRWKKMIAPTRFDGLFICFRSQSRPAEDGDQFGFNQPVRGDFQKRSGADIWCDDFDRRAWRDLLGEYITTLLEELRHAFDRRIGVGIARGDVLGPPLGNTTLSWRDWIRRGLLDHLIVNQNSSQCPSMWHQLWPMHRGTGYVENYLDGFGLPPLADHLRSEYGPAVEGSGTRLFVARQWDGRSDAREQELRTIPGVSGLVFSSFRHDNPAAIARGDWRAGVLKK